MFDQADVAPQIDVQNTPDVEEEFDPSRIDPSMENRGRYVDDSQKVEQGLSEYRRQLLNMISQNDLPVGLGGQLAKAAGAQPGSAAATAAQEAVHSAIKKLTLEEQGSLVKGLEKLAAAAVKEPRVSPFKEPREDYLQNLLDNVIKMTKLPVEPIIREPKR